MQLHGHPQGKRTEDPSQSGQEKPSTLAVHIHKLARSGLEKAELSGQDTTLCLQLNLPSSDQQTSASLRTSPLSEQQLRPGSNILKPSM